MSKVFTVGYVVDVQNDRVLLGLKKTKIGKGLWNGYGGKVEVGEGIAVSMRRELEEESGLVAQDIEYLGMLTVRMRRLGVASELHFYRVLSFSGILVESNEMVPRWFDVAELPYDKMWSGDKEFLPLLLAGKRVAGELEYTDFDDRTLLTCDLREVEKVLK